MVLSSGWHSRHRRPDEPQVEQIYKACLEGRAVDCLEKHESLHKQIDVDPVEWRIFH